MLFFFRYETDEEELASDDHPVTSSRPVRKQEMIVAANCPKVFRPQLLEKLTQTKFPSAVLGISS